jgi:toluene monooxygenase system protein E
MNGRRTYWHLESLNRKPAEYEIVSTHLLYHPDRGFEVQTPVTEWYRKHVKESPLVLADADRFRDPRETTYTTYTALQKDKEIYVDGLLESIERTNYDKALSPAWLRTLSRVLPPLRYPVHALQMTAAYVGQMAPGSRITMAALFQSADEMRRIQRIAYRMRQLAETHPGFGNDARAIWQEDPLWQPLREVLEKLLIAYDWGESFVGLNLVVKPLMDGLFMTHFAALANKSGDPILARIFESLAEDGRWHRQWSVALARLLLRDREEHAGLLRTWIRRWHDPAIRAVAGFGPLFGAAEFPAVMEGVRGACAELWSSAGLSRVLD